jgi:hypothetical protein
MSSVIMVIGMEIEKKKKKLSNEAIKFFGLQHF